MVTPPPAKILYLYQISLLARGLYRQWNLEGKEADVNYLLNLIVFSVDTSMTTSNLFSKLKLQSTPHNSSHNLPKPISCFKYHMISVNTVKKNNDGYG